MLNQINQDTWTEYEAAPGSTIEIAAICKRIGLFFKTAFIAAFNASRYQHPAYDFLDRETARKLAIGEVRKLVPDFKCDDNRG